MESHKFSDLFWDNEFWFAFASSPKYAWDATEYDLFRDDISSSKELISISEEDEKHVQSGRAGHLAADKKASPSNE